MHGRMLRRVSIVWPTRQVRRQHCRAACQPYPAMLTTRAANTRNMCVTLRRSMPSCFLTFLIDDAIVAYVTLPEGPSPVNNPMA